MLGEQDGDPQLPVELGEDAEKVGGCNRVQLAGGLVQDEELRVQGHHSGKVEELFLSPGEGGDIPVEPILDAEEGGHLRHPAADKGGVPPQGLQAEGQLVPDLVGDQLTVGGLPDKADAPGLLPLVIAV